MRPLQLLNSYLERLESRFRLAAVARGAAVVAVAALALTLLLVIGTNWYAFSSWSLTGGRFILFVSLALAVGFGLIVPLLRLNRRRAAQAAEQKVKDFDQRLVTIAEKQQEGVPQPFLELLADDTLKVAQHVEPSRIIGGRLLAGLVSAAVLACGVLLWLILGASGYLGYGARLLWAGAPRGEAQPFYDIVITPGDRTVRRGASQAVTAQLVGFDSPTVRLYARYQDSAKWEEAPMVPRQASAQYEFLFAGLPQSVEYYAAAGKLHSKTYKLSVIDVPGVKRLRVTYRYPDWSGLGQQVEDPGGDLRAVEGTEAEISVETDRPLNTGQLVMEDGSKVALEKQQGNWTTARVKIAADGSYHVAALEQGDLVRLTDDYFIEVRKDEAPLVSLVRPGRDAKVNPIEEVTASVQGSDEFGLRELTLHYSVNGGPEKTVSMLKQNGAKESSGSTVLYLEDYKLVPGDLVSLYATARGPRQSSKTDMFFVETQPFEREYTQSQQMGGGGGEGMGSGEREGQISQRQKEIINATWNQSRDTRDKSAAAENAGFLSGMQSKLRDQAQSLSTRMGRRELSGENQEFQSFSNDMQEAAKDMAVAAEKLKGMKWQEALTPEQQALQHLLRAEATYRQIQVAFGNRGGGGGGGGSGAQRDLESLFDLELDTEKNQYETGQQASTGSAQQRSREIDEALQRLEQLARRQQELAQQQRQPQQSFQQRWQQEMLRREAEQLQQRMQQLSRSGQSGQSSGGQQSASGQGSRSAADARLDQALRRLSDATDDMRRASSAQAGNSQQGQADSKRAAERLREAQDLMRGMRTDQAGQQLDDLARRSEKLAQQQSDFENQLKQMFPGQPSTSSRYAMPGTDRQQLEKAQGMAAERDKMADELGAIEREMQRAAREMAGSQRAATSRLRNALGDLQQNEVQTRMRYNNDLLRRGFGSYLPPRETPVTQGLQQLRDELRAAQGAIDRGSPDRGAQDNALARLEQLRNRLQEMTRQGGQQPGQRGQGQQGQQGQSQQGQGQGQQGQQGQQGGQGQQAGGQGGGGGIGPNSGDRTGGWYNGQRGGIRAQNQGWGFDRSAINQGDWRPAPLPGRIGPVNPADFERAYRESMRDLSDLRRELAAGSPEATRDIQELLAQMQRLDPSRFAGNPELLERLRSEVLPALEQIELQVRRQADEQQGGQVRNSGGEPVPPGYSGAVAEYFRRLSQSK